VHPAIPILAIAALVSWIGEDPPPAPTVKERIILLPDADGRVGAVTVSGAGGEEASLDRAYATAQIMSDGKIQSGEETAESVRQRYGSTFGTLPPVPVSFNVYFLFDKDELTPESTAQFGSIKSELAHRPAPEIVVIGHTDRVGTLEYNDKLSLKRADVVRAALVAAGIPPGQIDIAGRGEREPSVATPDETAEPRNRRVEIMVR